MLLLLFPHLHIQAQQAQQTYKEKTMPRGTRITVTTPPAPKKKAVKKKVASKKQKKEK